MITKRTTQQVGDDKDGESHDLKISTFSFSAGGISVSARVSVKDNDSEREICFKPAEELLAAAVADAEHPTQSNLAPEKDGWGRIKSA